MVGRPTFYKHFADKNDFFEFFMRSMRDELHERTERAVTGEGSGVSPQTAEGFVHDELSMLTALMDFFLEHERLVDNMLRSNLLPTLFYSFYEFVSKGIEEHLRETAAGADDASTAASASFLAGGIIQMLVRWWTLGHTEEGKARVVDLVRPHLETAARERQVPLSAKPMSA